MVYCLYCKWKGRGEDSLCNHWDNCEKKKESNAKGIWLSYIPDLARKKTTLEMKS